MVEGLRRAEVIRVNDVLANVPVSIELLRAVSEPFLDLGADIEVVALYIQEHDDEVRGLHQGAVAPLGQGQLLKVLTATEALGQGFGQLAKETDIPIGERVGRAAVHGERAVGEGNVDDTAERPKELDKLISFTSGI